jgi:hypothetical protein
VKDGSIPQTRYEQKLKLIVDSALARFNGKHTPEDYELELQVAKNYLKILGINP